MFFVASDSREEKEALISVFGDRILVSQGIELKRNCENGIKDALVEMLCLSCCRKIIGSFKSSFTDVAAGWHKDTELVIAQQSTADISK